MGRTRPFVLDSRRFSMHRFMTITCLTFFCVSTNALAADTSISMPPPPPGIQVVQSTAAASSIDAKTQSESVDAEVTVGDIALHRYGNARTTPSYSYESNPYRYGYNSSYWFGHGHSSCYSYGSYSFGIGYGYQPFFCGWGFWR